MADPVRESAAEAVGKLIRAARERHGWSQEDLAWQLGLSQTAISYWETGSRQIDVAKLIEVAGVLDLDPAELLPRVAGYRLAGPGEVVVRLPEPADEAMVLNGTRRLVVYPRAVLVEGDTVRAFGERLTPGYARQLGAELLAGAIEAERATSPAEPTTSCTCGIDLPGATPEHMPDCALMACAREAEHPAGERGPCCDLHSTACDPPYEPCCRECPGALR